jgi:hypothetical protein
MDGGGVAMYGHLDVIRMHGGQGGDDDRLIVDGVDVDWHRERSGLPGRG